MKSRLLALLAYLPFGGWGLGAYMAYQAAHFGDPMAFIDAQNSWHVRPIVPPAEKWLALATLEPVWDVYIPSSANYWGRFNSHWALL